jgi:tRNA-splicing ligase RtcB
MKKVHYTNELKVPIKMWLDDIESGALTQAEHLAQLPFSYKHVAIMPDAHPGYGMPIGGVVALDGAVIPNAVGVDIGCGMTAVRTDILASTIEPFNKNGLKDILGKIRQNIPVGFNHHKYAKSTDCLPLWKGDGRYIISKEWQKALKQIGTLGGGNHFIEIQKGSDDYIWIMIHSGSRNVGLQVAKYYNKIAIEQNKKWSCSIPTNWQLAFLPIDTDYGRDYIREMEWCVKFATMSRRHMMLYILDVFSEVLGGVRTLRYHNVSHNYAAVEKHFGKEVVVHRKGATRAFKDEYGIIPGSQGTKSYIVKGLGNEQSFHSCSHGAGRIMSRKKAREELSLEDEQIKLESQNILHSLRGKKALDEAPGAYKNINIVMANQKDLVEIDIELTPLAVVKG